MTASNGSTFCVPRAKYFIYTLLSTSSSKLQGSCHYSCLPGTRLGSNYLLLGCTTSIYPSSFPFEGSLLAFADSLLGPEQGVLFSSAIGWSCESGQSHASCWTLVQSQGSWRFCRWGCVQVRPFLSIPRCVLASNPMKLCFSSLPLVP